LSLSQSNWGQTFEQAVGRGREEAQEEKTKQHDQQKKRKIDGDWSKTIGIGCCGNRTAPWRKELNKKKWK